MTTIINRRAAWLGPVRAFHGRIVSGVVRGVPVVPVAC